MEIRSEGFERMRFPSGENTVQDPTTTRVMSKSELLKDNHVQINFCSVGCVVRIGCTSVAFHDNQQMLAELTAYVNNPHEAKERWQKIVNEQ